MKILSDGNSFVWAVHLVVDEVWDNQRTRQIYYICSECSTLFLKSFTHQYQTSHLFPWQTANWHYKTDTTDELTFELISNVFFHLSNCSYLMFDGLYLPKVYAILNDFLSVWRDHYFAVLLNLSRKHIFLFKSRVFSWTQRGVIVPLNIHFSLSFLWLKLVWKFNV